MANTTTSSCYQAVGAGLHWHTTVGGGPLAPPSVVLLQQKEDTSALQACALLTLAWTLSTLLPKPQPGRQHFKTLVLKWLSGTDLLLFMVGCIISLGSNGINLASITNNLPMVSGSFIWQALQITRLTMMVWFIKKLYGSPSKSSNDHQQKRKISQRKSQTGTEFTMDFISKSLDKFIIFAVLIASVILFFNSVCYLAVKSMVSLIYKSHFYKSSLNLVKQLTYQLTLSLGKHPLNRKLMVLVPTSLVISACVSSVQALDYV